uniref:Regulator of microtubule dynamics protein 3-like n=1 Tax=Saccoglossus kowalevskii TaxID=10224 RepID=A0ABM0M0R9_SACKO|nr:PREDICTED: regulator of microtubule dynamics protein 3-like [Saccoglossus kowalevskii]
MSLNFGRHLPAVGVGFLIGASAALVVDRVVLTGHLNRIRISIDELRREWLQMKDKLDTGTRKRRTRISRDSTDGSEYFSAHPSSGEEEEDFEEALDWYTTPPQALLYKDARESFENEEDETLKALFEEVDILYRSTDDDKYRAFELLKEKFPLVGKDHAFAAITLDDNCPDAHKWYALCVGSSGQYESTQQRITNGFLYKEHIEKAIRLRPTEASLRHFLGRWCYEVAQLSWLERKAASALYATPPSATVDEALEHFLKAESLQPGFWKTNTLFIARCYIQKASYVYARTWLEKCLEMPYENTEEELAHEEANKLLTKYRDY